MGVPWVFGGGLWFGPKGFTSDKLKQAAKHAQETGTRDALRACVDRVKARKASADSKAVERPSVASVYKPRKRKRGGGSKAPF